MAFSAGLPSVFVRKASKDHGLGRRIEGGDVSGRRTILVEDMVTTGGSSLSAIEALREAGAEVADCFAIITYGFREALEAFEAAGALSVTSSDAADQPLLEPGPGTGVGDGSHEHLERDLPVQALVERPVHDPHPASAELGEDAVVGEGLADQVGGLLRVSGSLAA